MSPAELFVASFLILLGITALILAAIVGFHSYRGGRSRAAGLALVGIVALVVLPFILGWPSLEDVWDELLSHLLVMVIAALVGALLAFWLLYVLAEAR
jgi:hypothetical protein